MTGCENRQIRYSFLRNEENGPTVIENNRWITENTGFNCNLSGYQHESHTDIQNAYLPKLHSSWYGTASFKQKLKGMRLGQNSIETADGLGKHLNVFREVRVVLRHDIQIFTSLATCFSAH